MADIFDVISDPTRRDILQALHERYSDTGSPTGEMSVGELVERLGITQPTVSKHLKVLRDNGLASVREEGQHRFYRLNAAPLEALKNWLTPYLLSTRGLGSDGPEATDDETAWPGVDVAETIGRRAAEGAYQARTAAERVTNRFPIRFRRVPFRNY